MSTGENVYAPFTFHVNFTDSLRNPNIPWGNSVPTLKLKSIDKTLFSTEMFLKDIEAHSNPEHEHQRENVPGFQLPPYTGKP